MTDLLGAIALSGILATFLALLIGLMPISTISRLTLSTIALGWIAAVVGIAAAGGFAPSESLPFPAVGIALMALIVTVLIIWTWSGNLRRALLSIPLPALVAMHAGRFLGAFFLVLMAEGRLSAPFAPTAAWGDIAVAALAVLLATGIAAGAAIPTRWIAAWNGLGAFDLLVAVVLGLLSAPDSPLRIFGAEPGTSAMGNLPWVMIPTLLVPLYLFTHLIIAAKLHTAANARGDGLGGNSAPVGAA